MPEQLQSYRIFIATPSGLEVERRAFRDLITEFNESDAIPRGAHFILVRWEITLGGVGRPQSIINEEVKRCDFFVMVLHNRWGSSPDPDGRPGPYRSGTEEEYHIALECIKVDGMPMRQIVPFFKAVDPAQLADPGPQLAEVIAFRQQLERDKNLFYETYDEPTDFIQRVRRYLSQWLRDHDDGNTAKAEPPERPVVPPPQSDRPINDLSDERAGEGESDNVTRKLVTEAEKLADEGKLVEAETLFSKAIVRGSPNAINGFGHFLSRIGRLTQAQVMYERVLELALAAKDEEWRAIALGNLGQIEMTRGNLEAAEKLHRESLEIDRKLGHLEGQANQLGNLGLIEKTRGNLDEAEKLLRESLEINRKLGRLEGQAANLGNLGLIEKTHGNLDKAEKLHRESLEIERKLGHLEGQANALGNLGVIAKRRGDLKQARELWTEARDLYARIGMPQMVEKVQGWIDGVEGEEK